MKIKSHKGNDEYYNKEILSEKKQRWNCVRIELNC